MVKVGYDDTPFIPEQKWRVHDSARPQPKIVDTQGAPGKAPSDAVVLFDGKDTSAWVNAKDGGPCGWKVESGYLEVVHGVGNIQTKAEFGDCQLHIEWASPTVIEGESQGRGNSGVFLLGKYEVQVLDCYENPTYADGTAGAIYGQYPPLVNPSRAPGQWQTFDIIFEAPRWDAKGALLSPAYITVIYNGVVVQNRQAAQGPTGHKTVSDYYTPHGLVGALLLQDHRNDQ
jgi:hypothetical protein